MGAALEGAIARERRGRAQATGCASRGRAPSRRGRQGRDDGTHGQRQARRTRGRDRSPGGAPRPGQPRRTSSPCIRLLSPSISTRSSSSRKRFRPTLPRLRAPSCANSSTAPSSRRASSLVTDPFRSSRAPGRPDAVRPGQSVGGSVGAQGGNHTQPPTRRTAVCP